MNYIPKLPDSSVNHPKQNLLFLALKLLIGLIVAVATFYLLATLSVNIIAEHLSPKTEAKITKYIHVNIDMNKTEQNTKLQQIVDRLSKCAKLPYKVDILILDDFHTNAMAIPGGTILVTKGLLHRTKNENELAMVIGHELGHFKYKDSIKALGKGLIFATAATLLSIDNYGSVFTTTLELANNRYSQEQEMAADIFGVDMLECAYGSVNGATTLFEEMKKEEKEWKYILADHPDFNKRIDAINSHIRQRNYDTTQPMIPLKKLYE